MGGRGQSLLTWMDSIPVRQEQGHIGKLSDELKSNYPFSQGINAPTLTDSGLANIFVEPIKRELGAPLQIISIAHNEHILACCDSLHAHVSDAQVKVGRIICTLYFHAYTLLFRILSTDPIACPLPHFSLPLQGATESLQDQHTALFQYIKLLEKY